MTIPIELESGGTPRTVKITVIRSKRRSMSLEVRPDLSVLLRAPYFAAAPDLYAFAFSRRNWIEKALRNMEVREAADAPRELLSRTEIRELAERAAREFPPRVERLAKRIGVTYGRITIRNQKTRWGSCSSRGNLNFNCLLLLTPPEIQEYVIVHELCHRKEMNHSPRFWKEVERILPDYRNRVRWLHEHETAILRRMTG